MSLSARRVEFLNRHRRRSNTETVTYARGGVSIEIPATIGRSNFDAQSEDGSVAQTSTIDWLITAADLVLDNEQTLPESGDRITHHTNGFTCVYEVIQQTSAQAWEDSGGHMITLRIHTTLVERTHD